MSTMKAIIDPDTVMNLINALHFLDSFNLRDKLSIY